MEKDYLKTIVHRLYGKFMTMRPVIRTLMIASLNVELNVDFDQ
jgi:hypothetical protein